MLRANWGAHTLILPQSRQICSGVSVSIPPQDAVFASSYRLLTSHLFTDNLRFAISWCLFGYPNNTAVGDTPCITRYNSHIFLTNPASSQRIVPPVGLFRMQLNSIRSPQLPMNTVTVHSSPQSPSQSAMHVSQSKPTSSIS